MVWESPPYSSGAQLQWCPEGGGGGNASFQAPPRSRANVRGFSGSQRVLWTLVEHSFGQVWRVGCGHNPLVLLTMDFFIYVRVPGTVLSWIKGSTCFHKILTAKFKMSKTLCPFSFRLRGRKASPAIRTLTFKMLLPGIWVVLEMSCGFSAPDHCSVSRFLQFPAAFKMCLYN